MLWFWRTSFIIFFTAVSQVRCKALCSWYSFYNQCCGYPHFILIFKQFISRKLCIIGPLFYHHAGSDLSSHIQRAGLFKSSCVSKQGREIEPLGIIHTVTMIFQGKKISCLNFCTVKWRTSWPSDPKTLPTHGSFLL